METGSLLTGLECRACGTKVGADAPIGTCPACGHTLFASYDLDGARSAGLLERFRERPASVWRYRELLPVRDASNIVTLGEGGTPVLRLTEVPEAPGVEVWLKEDGVMPTGSFKARGMAVAVSRARELGLTSLYVPSAGNAGLALAAYGARAGLPVRVYLPESTAADLQRICRAYGAEVIGIPGTIKEAGEAARAREKSSGGFDMSTLREPYRAEGKKTMGLEIFDQFGGTGLPDVIVYPTGGGTGLVGMHKAFQELRHLGGLETAPRLIAVQMEGCAPVVRALQEGTPGARPWDHPRTIAPGLLVPAPFSSERVLEAIRATHGDGVTVPDRSLPDAMEHLARRHGVSSSPEAAAVYAALPLLLSAGKIRPGERVLLYNTGSGAMWDADTLRKSLER
ncbi:MAG TPA: threonine synthase [Thermoplasmata archaeon]|nr:threonine synthase [Thermoplasmata archaeon]